MKLHLSPLAYSRCMQQAVDQIYRVIDEYLRCTFRKWEWDDRVKQLSE